MDKLFDTIVIGGGQSGLACAYYLKRAKLNYYVLDKQNEGGGAWVHGWDSLTLFSPAEYSSLPGWIMPKLEHKYPLRVEVINYLTQYEKHYQFPIERSREVIEVIQNNKQFKVVTTNGDYFSKTVIAAAGTWNNPFIPDVIGKEIFKGIQIHSAFYKNPSAFLNLKVLVVGEGNSGAQIVAELSRMTKVKWSTKKTPEFLSDEVDGYALFNAATAKYKAEKEGKPLDPVHYNLGNIVMVPSVVEARKRGVLISSGIFSRFYENGVIWENGTKEEFDAIIWCTGFGFNTKFLNSIIKTDTRGMAATKESKSADVDGLWMVGYGDWTGYASATLIGLNRTAKQTIIEIENYLK